MREILLTQNKFAKIDDDDYERVSKFKWCCPKGSRGRIGYAKHTIRIGTNKRRDVFLHRFIMNCPDDMFVDHINHDVLDNRKENLRLCTAQQNAWNRIIKIKTNTGLPFIHRRVYNGKRVHRIIYAVSIGKKFVGNFKDLGEAYDTVQRLLREQRGKFAVTG